MPESIQSSCLEDIVVIGGSAGSLTPLRTLVQGFPKDFAAGVFVVLHTSKGSPGVLPELLNLVTTIPALYGFNNAPILRAGSTWRLPTVT